MAWWPHEVWSSLCELQMHPPLQSCSVIDTHTQPTSVWSASFCSPYTQSSPAFPAFLRAGIIKLQLLSHSLRFRSRSPWLGLCVLAITSNTHLTKCSSVSLYWVQKKKKRKEEEEKTERKGRKEERYKETKIQKHHPAPLLRNKKCFHLMLSKWHAISTSLGRLLGCQFSGLTLDLLSQKSWGGTQCLMSQKPSRYILMACSSWRTAAFGQWFLILDIYWNHMRHSKK